MRKYNAIPEAYYRDAARFPVQKWDTTRRQFLNILRLRREISSLDNKWHSAFKAGDHAAMRQLATMMSNDKSTISGIEHNIITGNLRLAVGIACKYGRRLPNSREKASTLELSDLISAANTGLTIAVKNFDVRKGLRFSTYATYPIKTHIIDELQRQYVSLPHQAVMQIKSVLSAESALFKNGQFHPTDDQVVDMMREQTGEKWSIDELANLRLLKEATHNRVGPNKASVKYDTSADDIYQADSYWVNRAVSILPQRLRDIIKKRYLSGSEVRTFRELAPEFGVTKAAVQQMEAEAIRQIRIWIRANIKERDKLYNGRPKIRRQATPCSELGSRETTSGEILCAQGVR